MELNFQSIVEDGKKNVVIMFKNQRKGVIDLWLLKHSIKQWRRLYPNTQNIIICGSYNKFEQEELLGYLTSNYLEKHKVFVLNVGEIPEAFNTHKVNRVNYQLICAWEALQSGFVLAYNDMFPIKPIDDTYLNKEYRILHKDYRYIKPSDMYWWAKFYIRTAEWFKEHYGLTHYTMYKAHNPQYYNKEFMEFYLKHPELQIDMNRDNVLLYFNLLQGHNIMRDDYMLNTYYKNKWIATKDKIKTAKMIDCAVPESPKTKTLLKKLLLK